MGMPIWLTTLCALHDTSGLLVSFASVEQRRASAAAGVVLRHATLPGSPQMHVAPHTLSDARLGKRHECANHWSPGQSSLQGIKRDTK